MSTVRLVVGRDGKVPSAVEDNVTHVHLSSNLSIPAWSPVHTRAVAGTQRRLDSMVKRDFSPDCVQQLPACTYLQQRCQGHWNQAWSDDEDEDQRSNVLVHDSPLQRDSGSIVLGSMQSQPRLITVTEEKAIEGLFWCSYLPLKDHDQMHADSGSSAPYQMLLEITSGSPLVKRCAQAVAFANLGRENGDRRLNMRGAQIYNAVASQARDMLAAYSTDTQQRDDLLACCVVMCTYELLRDDTERGSWYFSSYHNHVKCLCEVLRTVDVMDEPSTSMKYVWREARVMAGRSSIFVRQPVYGLDRPPKWRSTTASLILSDDVLDSMFALSQWFSEVDRVSRGINHSHDDFRESAAVGRVVQRGLEIAGNLRAWEKRAMAQYCDGLRPTLFSLCPTSDGELLNVLNNHWMVCMQLYSQLQFFVARFQPWYPSLKLPFWIDPWPPAVFIGVAGPMLSNPRFGTWAALTGYQPMVGAIFYFAATGNWHTPEARSLRDWVEDKHRLGNVFLRKFFFGLFANVDEILPQAEVTKIAQTFYGLRDRTPWKGGDESNK